MRVSELGVCLPGLVVFMLVVVSVVVSMVVSMPVVSMMLVVSMLLVVFTVRLGPVVLMLNLGLARLRLA